ncbi:MAG: hypothetical protein ACI4PM_06245 [Butyricicoccus sp.]
MSRYVIGFSVPAFVAWVLLLLPKIKWMLAPPKNNVLARNHFENKILNIVQNLSQIVLTVILLFVVDREHGNTLQVNSSLILAFLFLVIYYIAWTQYFRGRVTPFVLVFGIALMQPLYFLAAGTCLYNMAILPPCLIFGVLLVGVTVKNFGPNQ